MKYFSRSIFLFFFLILFRSAFAQQNQFHVPCSQTHDSKKLAFALTNNLTSDSAKIYAIHYWITHHLKYDIKKFVSFNYDHVSIKKILRKRKCTCVGYCDLMNDLCLH